MQTLETLGRRTDSLRGIRSVVHTMKTLSVINSAPYEQAAKAIEIYHETVLEGLHAFLQQVDPVASGAPDRMQRVLIIFGSDHGLCGNYNEALVAHVAGQTLGAADGPQTILCVGAQMADALTDAHLVPDAVLLPAASVDGIGRLANLLTQRLDVIRKKGQPRELAVSLAYIARDGGMGQKPVIASLLPLDHELLTTLQAKPWASRSRPFMSMQAEALFTALVRNHLFATLFRAIAEALLTENAARLALMQQAERSVDERLDDLTAETRSVRQDQITTELLDVIIGFEALKANRAGKARRLAKAQTSPAHPTSTQKEKRP